VRAVRRKALGGRYSLGRRRHHARMDAVLATAVPSVRKAAAHQVSHSTVTDISAIDQRPQAIASLGGTPFISEASVGDYVALMKPRVMALVVFTALVGLVLAPAHVQPVIGF